MQLTFLFKVFRGTSAFSSFLLKVFWAQIFLLVCHVLEGLVRPEVFRFYLQLLYFFFVKTFINTKPLKVIFFWEISQQTDILAVFVFKVYMRSAVFIFFCSIYTFLFRELDKESMFYYCFQRFDEDCTLQSFLLCFYFLCQTFYGD